MWNVGQLNVFEDEGIIRRLRIIKIRETEQSMNVSVEVIPKNESNEAHQGMDHIYLCITILIVVYNQHDFVHTQEISFVYLITPLSSTMPHST